MNTKLLKSLVTSTAALAMGATAFGAGYALFESSAAGNADAAGLMTKGGQPSAMFFSPAAISDLEGTQVSVGSSFLLTHFSIDGKNPYTGETMTKEAEDRLFALPHVYVTHKLSDDVQVGLGIYEKFGLGLTMDGDWYGRYSNVEVDIMTVTVAPTISYKLSDSLSIGASLNVQGMNVAMKQKIPGSKVSPQLTDPMFDITQEVESDISLGLGASVGINWDATENLHLAASYTSRVKHDIDGDISYYKHPVLNAAPVFKNTTGSAELTTPDEVILAASYDFTDKLTLGAAVTYTSWSVFDELVIEYDSLAAVGAPSVTATKNWKDTVRFAFGGSYQVNENWVLRASYTYDDSPLNKSHPDYLVPAHDRHIFAVGAGWTKGDWTVDMSYFYEFVKGTDVKADFAHGVYEGSYNDSNANCFGVTVTRRF